MSEHDDEYHVSKSGYYTECGKDFNPHHAERVGEGKAKLEGYNPCMDCFVKRDL